MILPRNEFQKKAKSKMHDNWARVLAAVSIVVSLSSVYYTRFQTPYFYAQPNQMSYWTIEANSLTDDKKPKSSQLAVHVYNDSDTPARDVLVVIQPLSLLPKITCSEAYELQEGINGAMLITIKRVPSKTTVQVDVSEDVTEYPHGTSPYFEGLWFRYCGSVNDVQTEFGAIKKSHAKCKAHHTPMPEDLAGSLRI